MMPPSKINKLNLKFHRGEYFCRVLDFPVLHLVKVFDTLLATFSKPLCLGTRGISKNNPQRQYFENNMMITRTTTTCYPISCMCVCICNAIYVYLENIHYLCIPYTWVSMCAVFKILQPKTKFKKILVLATHVPFFINNAHPWIGKLSLNYIVYVNWCVDFKTNTKALVDTAARPLPFPLITLYIVHDFKSMFVH